MKKIAGVSVLKEFEIHHLGKDNEHILVWNVLDKKEYFSLKRKANASVRKYERLMNKSETAQHPLVNIIEKSLSKNPARNESENFYVKRITERKSFRASVLLKAEILPEQLLRQLHLKDATSFILVRAGDVYVGILAKRATGGLLSMINGLGGDSPFSTSIGDNPKIGGMSIIPLPGGDTIW